MTPSPKSHCQDFTIWAFDGEVRFLSMTKFEPVLLNFSTKSTRLRETL